MTHFHCFTSLAIVVAAVVFSGCTESKPKIDPVEAFSRRLEMVADKYSKLEQRVKESNSIWAHVDTQQKIVQSQTVQLMNDRNEDKVAVIALAHRIEELESKQTDIERELRLAQAALRLAKSESKSNTPTNKPSPTNPERSRESLLAVLEQGYRKSLIAGLDRESKARALAQYLYFKQAIEEGRDPRISFRMLELFSAEDVIIIRSFYPEFLPSE